MIQINIEKIIEAFNHYEIDAEQHDKVKLNILALNLLKKEEYLMRILMAIKQLGYERNLINFYAIAKHKFVKQRSITFLKEIIDGLRQIGEKNTNLALIKVSKSYRKAEYFELTPLGHHLLRCILNENPKEYKNSKRKSGGVDHIGMIDTVKSKLMNEGWEIYSEEESFHVEDNIYVYPDIMAFKETSNGKIFRTFEVETGHLDETNHSNEKKANEKKDELWQFQQQIEKNIKKSLVIGNSAYIICFDREVEEKVKRIARSYYFKNGERGLIQIITIMNFLKNREWYVIGALDQKWNPGTIIENGINF